MNDKINLTPEQLAEVKAFFQQNDFTANMAVERMTRKMPFIFSANIGFMPKSPDSQTVIVAAVFLYFAG